MSRGRVRLWPLPVYMDLMPCMILSVCSISFHGLSIMLSALSIYSMLVISVMELRLIAALYCRFPYVTNDEVSFYIRDAGRLF